MQSHKNSFNHCLKPKGGKLKVDIKNRFINASAHKTCVVLLAVTIEIAREALLKLISATLYGAQAS